MRKKTWGALAPADNIKIFDRLRDAEVELSRVVAVLDEPLITLDELLDRIGGLRATLDTARAEIVAARGI